MSTPSSDALFFLRLWTAAHRGERLVARELEAAGVSGRQLAMLLLLGAHEPATPTALAGELGVPFMTASDALQRLEAAGDATHAPNPNDKRSQVYSLTPAGRVRLRAVEEPLQRARLAAETATAPGLRLHQLTAAVGELDDALAQALEER